ncbi:MAG: glycosyltransferase [Lentisphaerae bacterium]|nr:glycosyltransferase [Lentisphaerota bacterium]
MTIGIPVLNEGRDIRRCLDSIKRQDYPADRLEVLVADGGSTDKTVSIVQEFGYTVVPNPERLAEPGLSLLYGRATGELFVHMAADNVLHSRLWLREMTAPFAGNSNVMGSFCKVDWVESDDPFLKYFNSDTDPFSSFFYGNASHPDKFRKLYRVKHETPGYVIFDFPPRRFPLLAFAQGFMVRHAYQRPPETFYDDILPVIDLIRKGYDIAYVKSVTIGHYVFDDFAHYRRRMLRKVSESFVDKGHGFHVRERNVPFGRKLRQYLFVPYGLTVVGPFLGTLAQCLRRKRWFYWYRVPASFLLAWYILYLFFAVRLFRTRKTPVAEKT